MLLIHTKKSFLIWLFITVALLTMLFLLSRVKVPDFRNYVLKENSDKTIYRQDTQDYGYQTIREDCRKKGGIFNTCGSYCFVGEECTPACAYTCEFNKPVF